MLSGSLVLLMYQAVYCPPPSGPDPAVAAVAAFPAETRLTELRSGVINRKCFTNTLPQQQLQV